MVRTFPPGGRAYWEIDAPSGLAIVGVHTEGPGMISYGVDQAWAGAAAFIGRAEEPRRTRARSATARRRSVLVLLRVADHLRLEHLQRGHQARRDQHPRAWSSRRRRAPDPRFVTPGSLGAASGWVRGTWPIAFSADGPTGACQLAASLAGASVSQPLNEPQSQVTWHQCPAGSFSQSFNTAAVASGAGVPLVMWARDAAYDYSAGHYLSGTATSYVNIDNDPVSVSVSGPTDAPSTAGTQYVTATGTAGPSGVSGIGCSVDGAPYQWYPRPSVQIPVAGIGVHRVTCYSANNARDAAGHVATSAPQTWTLSIREPTVSGIGFAKLVDSLLCKRVIKRVKVPAHWVTVRRHHRRVRVKRRARTKLERVMRCHPRIVRRRITVWTIVKRHGKRSE